MIEVNETVHTIGQTFGTIMIFVLMFLKEVKNKHWIFMDL